MVLARSGLLLWFAASVLEDLPSSSHQNVMGWRVSGLCRLNSCLPTLSSGWTRGALQVGVGWWLGVSLCHVFPSEQLRLGGVGQTPQKEPDNSRDHQGVLLHRQWHEAQSHGSNAEVPASSLSALCLIKGSALLEPEAGLQPPPHAAELPAQRLLSVVSALTGCNSSPTPWGLLKCVGTVSVVTVVGARMVAVVLLVPWLLKIP